MEHIQPPSADDFNLYIEQGKSLGKEGEELVKFVTEREQKAYERYERYLLSMKAHELELVRASGKYCGNLERRKLKFKLPKFRKGDCVETFIQTFEKFLDLNRIPEKEHKGYFQLAIQGNPEVERKLQLASADQSTYVELKKKILMQFQLPAEEQLKKFRNTNVKLESPEQVWNTLDYHAKKWYEVVGGKIGPETQWLHELIVKEQFLSILPENIRVLLLNTCYRIPVQEMIHTSERLLEAYRKRESEEKEQGKSTSHNVSDGLREERSIGLENRGPKLCYGCGREGHIVKFCREIDTVSIRESER